jgi:hypothetical protein
VEAEEHNGFTQQQVSRRRKAPDDHETFLNQIVLVVCRRAGVVPPEIQPATLTRDNEWYTAPRYIELARRMMGGIDVDPASHGFSQQWIKAATFYTPAEDGLAQEWRGQVWLARPQAGQESRVSWISSWLSATPDAATRRS